MINKQRRRASVYIHKFLDPKNNLQGIYIGASKNTYRSHDFDKESRNVFWNKNFDNYGTPSVSIVAKHLDPDYAAPLEKLLILQAVKLGLPVLNLSSGGESISTKWKACAIWDDSSVSRDDQVATLDKPILAIPAGYFKQAEILNNKLFVSAGFTWQNHQNSTIVLNTKKSTNTKIEVRCKNKAPQVVDTVQLKKEGNAATLTCAGIFDGYETKIARGFFDATGDVKLSVMPGNTEVWLRMYGIDMKVSNLHVRSSLNHSFTGDHTHRLFAELELINAAGQILISQPQSIPVPVPTVIKAPIPPAPHRIRFAKA